VVRAPVAEEREIVLRTIYQMTEPSSGSYWISKVFRAEAASGPRIVYSNEEATGLVGALPGASVSSMSAQVPRPESPPGDGRLPGEPGIRCTEPEVLDVYRVFGRRRFDAREFGLDKRIP